jgi:hypothetical protein
MLEALNVHRLLDVTTALSLGLILLVLVSVRRAHIRVEYSVSWLFAGVVLFLLSRSHWLLDRVTSLLGVGNAPAVLLLIVLTVFLLVFFRFTILISKLKDHNIALAQRVAILEYQVRSLDEEHQTKAKH